jgi:sugar lactone lactonase YvrE
MLHRTLLIAVGLGLLAACSNSSPSGFMPTSVGGQSQSIAAGQSLQPGADAHTSRVLYIADIDGQPGVGQIHVYTADMKNPRFLRMITNGTGRPFGLFVDKKNILYVANIANKFPSSVTEFKPGASSPFFSITNFKGYPESVAVDVQGNVYVNESVQDEGWVQVYAPGSNVPSRSIDTGVGGYAFLPGSMAFDPQGNLVVAEQAKLALHVVKIPPGSSNPTPLNLNLNGITGPGLGIDKAGNIYIASQGGTVSVFAPGQTSPSRTISPVAGYGLTWVTPQGAVYQASGEGSVTEIAPGSNSPTNTINCTCSAQGVAVSR